MPSSFRFAGCAIVRGLEDPVASLYRGSAFWAILAGLASLRISKLLENKATSWFDSSPLSKKLNPKAYDRCGHQPVITAARYSSQAEQFHIDLCLPRVA